MFSKVINLSTGPVALIPEVRQTFAQQPLSHRSAAFRQIFTETTELLSGHFGVRESFIFSGSGTAANEAMICQIKMLGGNGIVLCNGEFGNRLIEQASAHHLQFKRYIIPWGEQFDLLEIERMIQQNEARWLLFCHCETSSGVLNNLNELCVLATRANCKCFVDCISSVGAVDIDLSSVAMATASSGKGLCSVAGLALVFSNIDVASDGRMPIYFDLKHHLSKNKIPFTLSSNMVAALLAGCKSRLCSTNYALLRRHSKKLNLLLQKVDVLRFENFHVFTIVPHFGSASLVGSKLEQKNIVTSYSSEYLKKRNWLQLALFSHVSEEEMQYALQVLERILIHQLAPKAAQ